MKIICLFLILLVISGYSINCFLKPDDFCKKTALKKNCLAFNCGTRLCVYDESSCMDFISWGVLMKKYAKEPIVYTLLFFRESKIVNKMITKINGHIDSVLDKKKG